MKIRSLYLFVTFFLPIYLLAQTNPIAFFTKADALQIKAALPKYPMLLNSYNEIAAQVDAVVNTDVDVPFPKDAAGGYTHDKHKSNYMLMFNSGIMFTITGNSKYAALVKNMLLKYAQLNPTLGKHPQATSNFPGKIFWQSLNDANWLVYAGLAYDLIYTSLSNEERKTIEVGAFKPEVDFFINDMKDWFDLLHNHAVWACAGVGIVGIATHNNEYVQIALKGTKQDGKSGFIAQMDNLFSPDGYYTEGPYYVRYAILPYMLFANALNNAYPQMKIFNHRNGILQKALLTCLQQTNTNGVFFPLNDALKEKDYTTNELVTALSIAYKVYGNIPGFLTVAKKQNRVLLHSGGVGLAAAIASNKNVPAFFPYKTIESGDGTNGNEGGLSILRNGMGNNLSSLLFKYTSHGLSHGHFDKLNINFFDKGNEILQDYGSARFIGIEQKYGGRYLPENTKYAAQTIAHNTIVMDETSQFNGDAKIAEQYHAQKLFSFIENPNALVVAAKEDNAYKNTLLKRSEYLLQLPDQKKILVDIFSANSDVAHQYDLPFQYNGQFIKTNYNYSPFLNQQNTLGKNNGYQFLWKQAEAAVVDTTIQFTFLNDKTYYTISSLIQDSAKIYFTLTGANDPNFNLRNEPSFIIRKNGVNQLYINVVEVHGKYDPVNEFSTNAYPAVKQIKLLLNTQQYTIAQISIDNKNLIIAQSNNGYEANTKHSVSVNKEVIEWTGPYTILYEGKNLKYN